MVSNLVICSPLPGEMIQFDVRICFKWVIQPPTSDVLLLKNQSCKSQVVPMCFERCGTSMVLFRFGRWDVYGCFKKIGVFPNHPICS